MAAYKARIEGVLENCLALPDSGTARLREAMRYSSLGGGKRLRPLLVYVAGESLGAPLEKLDAPAAAVELIHAYSLVHDDLPAMDDDDLRRGRPTCHRAFDEATAILAGDALQTLAFQTLAALPSPPAVTVSILREISLAVGTGVGRVGDLAVDDAGAVADGTRVTDELAGAQVAPCRSEISPRGTVRATPVPRETRRDLVVAVDVGDGNGRPRSAAPGRRVARG